MKRNHKRLQVKLKMMLLKRLKTPDKFLFDQKDTNFYKVALTNLNFFPIIFKTAADLYQSRIFFLSSLKQWNLCHFFCELMEDFWISCDCN